jgi:hypothetical protein
MRRSPAEPFVAEIFCHERRGILRSYAFLDATTWLCQSFGPNFRGRNFQRMSGAETAAYLPRHHQLPSKV